MVSVLLDPETRLKSLIESWILLASFRWKAIEKGFSIICWVCYEVQRAETWSWPLVTKVVCDGGEKKSYVEMAFTNLPASWIRFKKVTKLRKSQIWSNKHRFRRENKK